MGEPPAHEPHADEPPAWEPSADERPADEPPADLLATDSFPDPLGADPLSTNHADAPAAEQGPSTPMPASESPRARCTPPTEDLTTNDEPVDDLFLNDKPRPDTKAEADNDGDPPIHSSPNHPLDAPEDGSSSYPFNPPNESSSSHPFNPPEDGSPSYPFDPPDDGSPSYPLDPPDDGSSGYPLDPPDDGSPDSPYDPPRTTRSTTRVAEEIASRMETSARQGLAAKLSAIKEFADRNSGTRPGRTTLYVHLTDETLLAGGGCMRVEGFGPVYAKLADLVGHNRITLQPVIDLHDQINENAYEIPTRLRERIKLTYPVEQFPYGPGETTNHTDIDHVIPYDPAGPQGQTSTANLRPLRRRSHRIKTFAHGWQSRPIDDTATEWTTRHGYKFRVDHTGTHPIPDDNP